MQTSKKMYNLEFNISISSLASQLQWPQLPEPQ